MQREDGSRPAKISKPARRWIWQLLGYAIAAACLYWVFRGIRFSDLLRSMAEISWGWVPVAAVFDLLVYVCAAWEWQLLLRPIGRLSFSQALKAMFAGRLANDVLPVHTGYIVRVYLAARWSRRSIAMVIPSLLIERFFDVLWLALGIGLTSLFFPLPQHLSRAGELLGGVILVAIAGLVWTIVRKKEAAAEREVGRFWRWKAAIKIRSFLQRLGDGVRGIGRSYLILAALGLSIVKLILQCLAFLALLQAYAFDFSLSIRLAIFLIAYIGISMPSTPAGVGVFQLLCSAGLRLFGVPKPVASGFALLAYVVLTAPLTLAGFIAVTRSGLSWRQIRREIGEWKRQFNHG